MNKNNSIKQSYTAFKSKPFWDGLKDVGSNIENATRDLKNQDKRFFNSLARATAGHVQAPIAYVKAGTT